MSAPGGTSAGVDSPFAELGIAPTLDPVAVKRAYFAALPLRPPHVDPEGFRRLRAAYEALVRPGGLSRAFAASPIDLAATLAGWEARFAAPLAAARDEADRGEAAAARLAAFIDGTGRMSFAEALALHAGPAVARQGD